MGLSAPAIAVNGNIVAIKPNSMKYTEGFGERKMRAQSTGGGGITHVYTDDIETQRSKVSFSVLATKENVENIKTWLINRENNAIQATDRGWSRNFQKAIIVNDPDISLGSDADIEVSFESKPAV